MNEVAIAAMLCNLLNGGETEVRHKFPNLGQERAVLVDCETPTHVIELGLDGSASVRDSVHQAIFAAYLTGKRPMVILIDRDGVQGRYEYEMSVVTRDLGVAYGICKENFIQAWAASALFRPIGLDKSLNDLPTNAVARSNCDLSGEFDLPDLGE